MICANDLRPKSQVFNLRVFVVNKGSVAFSFCLSDDACLFPSW
jgi:hypothetical protein